MYRVADFPDRSTASKLFRNLGGTPVRQSSTFTTCLSRVARYYATDTLNSIVLVHGFKSSKLSSSREYLENWLKNATRKHSKPTARASVFAFKEADVLSKGVDELQKISDKLLEKIRSLKVREVHIADLSITDEFRPLPKHLEGKGRGIINQQSSY
jgi:hypothetical protein